MAEATAAIASAEVCLVNTELRRDAGDVPPKLGMLARLYDVVLARVLPARRFDSSRESPSYPMRSEA